jgi:DNA repair protein RecO (recombination protein O)
MLQKTQAIVLNYIKYQETSVIAKIYTEQFGIQSYIINGVRSNRSKKGLALLQPLTILDLVVYHKTQKTDSLQRISEYKPSFSFKSIPFDVKKSAMALFITELLSKVLQQEEHPGAVFQFLLNFIKSLDERREAYGSLHLYLMVQLTHYIGFGIHDRKGLVNDNVVQKINTGFDQVYDAIIELNNFHLEDDFMLGNRLKQDVLTYLVNYYLQHVEGFKEMKSVDVLSQIFR